MDTNPFSIESILKKNSSTPTDNTEEPKPSKSTEALSLAVKLAGKLQFIQDDAYSGPYM